MSKECRDSTEVKVSSLHMAEPGSILGTIWSQEILGSTEVGIAPLGVTSKPIGTPKRKDLSFFFSFFEKICH